MPTLDELLNKAKKKTEKKKFSRGNRPDTMLRDEFQNAMGGGAAPSPVPPPKEEPASPDQGFTVAADDDHRKASSTSLSSDRVPLKSGHSGSVPSAPKHLDSPQPSLAPTSGLTSAPESVEIQRATASTEVSGVGDPMSTNSPVFEPAIEKESLEASIVTHITDSQQTRNSGPDRASHPKRFPRKASSFLDALDLNSVVNDAEMRSEPKEDLAHATTSAVKPTTPSSSETTASKSVSSTEQKIDTETKFEPSSNLVQTRFKNKIENPSLKRDEYSIQDGFNRNQQDPNEHNEKHLLFESEIGVDSTIDTPLIEPLEKSISNKTQFKLGSNLVQTPFKLGSNVVQTRFEPSSNMTNLEAENELNLVQTGFEPSLEPGSKISLKKLSPLQILILEYLNELCIELRSDVTSPVKISDLVTICNCSVEGAKTAIKRMLKQNVLSRVDYKDGRNGWCQYRISSHLHRELIDLKKSPLNLVQTRFKPSFELGSNAPSKLVSNNILNNTNLLTTPSNSEADAAESYDLLDISSINVDALAKFSITRKHLQDIKNQRLEFTSTTLQDFVDRFAIYASDPKNIRNINSLPGVFVKMAQMASKGDDPLSDIETDSDRLIQERLERLKAKREERTKHRNELMELEFENWLDEIKTKGQDEIAPPTSMVRSGSVAQKMILKDYFLKTVWPERASDLGV